MEKDPTNPNYEFPPDTDGVSAAPVAEAPAADAEAADEAEDASEDDAEGAPV